MGPEPTVTAELLNRAFVTGRRPGVTDDTRAAVRADLRRWRASAVVLPPAPPEVRALLVDLLGPGQRVRDVWLWRVGG
jgi:hypothetical protein